MNKRKINNKPNKNMGQKSNIVSDNFMFKKDTKKVSSEKISDIIKMLVILVINIFGMQLALKCIENSMFISIVVFIVLLIIDVPLCVRTLKKTNKAETPKIEKVMFGTTSLDEIFKSSEEIIHAEITVKTEKNEVDVKDESDEVEEYIPEVFLGDLTKNEANELLDNIHKYVLQNGIYVSLDDFRNLLSLMASDKIILLKNNSEYLDSFVMLLNQYFNSEYFGLDDINEEFVDISSSVNVLKSMKYAAKFDKNIVISLVTNVNSDKLGIYMPIIENSEYRNKSRYIEINKENIEIPKNLWCIMSLEEDLVISNISHELLANVALLDIEIKPVEQKEELVEYKNINYYYFEKMISDMLDVCGISEENYKKIDALEEYTNSISSFRLGNKLNLSLERFMAMNLSLEVQESQVLDNLVSSKILPMILSVLKGKNIDDGNQIDEKLERIFGEDNITSCQKVLRMNIEK